MFGACTAGDVTQDGDGSFLVCHKVDDETTCEKSDTIPTEDDDFHCANGVGGSHDAAENDEDSDGVTDEYDCDQKNEERGDDKPADDPGDKPGDETPGDDKTELEKYCEEHPDAEKCNKDEEPPKDEPPTDEEEPTAMEKYCAEHPDEEKCKELNGGDA